MTTYPIEIQRCRHIRTNGTQCGSPALKAKELCYFHNHNQPREVELYLDGERYCDRQIMLPVFEDAHSIQTMIRLVVQLLMSRRIERKDASLLLYALQIASGNLKTMHAERPKPTHMVVEPEKASATPLGMTPWSATGQGHDPEQEEDQEKNQEEDKRPPHADPTNDHLAPGTIQACQRPEPKAKSKRQKTKGKRQKTKARGNQFAQGSRRGSTVLTTPSRH